MHRFEKAWRRWRETNPQAAEPYWYEKDGRRVWRRPVPAVTLRLTLFTGLRLAHARGALATAGQWAKSPREFSFEWGRKRLMWPIAWEGACLRTLPLPGGPDAISVTHKANQARAIELELDRLEYDDQPEVIDRSLPE
jgi:hypothetical protein